MRTLCRCSSASTTSSSRSQIRTRPRPSWSVGSACGPVAAAVTTRSGTFNRLIWLGDTYLELIGVFDAALAGDSWLGAPTLRALERGGGLATLALATDDIETDVATLRTRGSDLADPIPGERARPDGRLVRWRLVGAAAARPGSSAVPHRARRARRRVDARGPRRARRRSGSADGRRARGRRRQPRRSRRGCGRSASASVRRSPAEVRATATSDRRSCGSGPDGPVPPPGSRRPCISRSPAPRPPTRTSLGSGGESQQDRHRPPDSRLVMGRAAISGW